MVFETNDLRKYSKTIGLLNTDYVYLDVPNSKIYIADDKTAIEVDVKFRDVSDDENKVFVISKMDFMHVVNFTLSLYMNSKYQYTSETNQIKGKFENSNDESDVVDSIKLMFDEKNAYNEFCTFDEDFIEKLMRAFVFVDVDNLKTDFRYIDIKDGYIFSSSKMRIYKNKLNVINDGLIDGNFIKFFMQFGVGTKLYNKENSYLLKSDNISIYLSTMNDVNYLPVLEENFKPRYERLFDENWAEFSCKDTLNKLNYIYFYAKNNPNSLINFTLTKDKCVISSLANEIELPIISSSIEKEIIIPCDSSALVTIFEKIKSKNFKIYFSSDEEYKLFSLRFNEDELVILAKINVN